MYERYERIVKSLRFCMRLEEPTFDCIEMDGGCCDSIGRCIPHLMDEAADAIEKLQKVANKLLAKYQEEATSVIWECSGSIDEDIDRLNEEVRTLIAQIDGMPLPEPPKEE